MTTPSSTSHDGRGRREGDEEGRRLREEGERETRKRGDDRRDGSIDEGREERDKVTLVEEEMDIEQRARSDLLRHTATRVSTMRQGRGTTQQCQADTMMGEGRGQRMTDGDDMPLAVSCGSENFTKRFTHGDGTTNSSSVHVLELGDKMDTGNQLASLRTTLANERTLLAWIRTGASLVAVGIAVTKFHSEHMIAGAGFFLAGFLTCSQGVIRYYQVNQVLRQITFSVGGPDHDRMGMKWFTILIMVVMSVCVISIIAVYITQHTTTITWSPRASGGILNLI